MKTFITILKTELKLSLRGMDMFIFAVCMPLVVLIVIGVIYGDAPAFEGASFTFLEQSFGALATIAICAGGVMGLPLVISDYRNKKICKRFKVTPISPAVLLLVQVTVYTLYALLSLLLLYITAALFFGFRFQGNLFDFLTGFSLTLVSMFSIGVMIGGIAPNTKIASVAASLLYFPMLIFSGATIPYEIMPEMMQKMADILPLTHGIKLLKAATLGTAADDIIIPVFIMCVITLVCIVIAIRFFRWE